jgi:hypothetical protein
MELVVLVGGFRSGDARNPPPTSPKPSYHATAAPNAGPVRTTRRTPGPVRTTAPSRGVWLVPETPSRGSRQLLRGDRPPKSTTRGPRATAAGRARERPSGPTHPHMRHKSRITLRVWGCLLIHEGRTLNAKGHPILLRGARVQDSRDGLVSHAPVCGSPRQTGRCPEQSSPSTPEATISADRCSGLDRVSTMGNQIDTLCFDA